MLHEGNVSRVGKDNIMRSPVAKQKECDFKLKLSVYEALHN